MSTVGRIVGVLHGIASLERRCVAIVIMERRGEEIGRWRVCTLLRCLRLFDR